ncbi:hypothetical protein ACET3Z_003074 [Daucus carota]
MISFCKKSFSTLFNIASTALTPPQEDSSTNHHPVASLPVTKRDTDLDSIASSGEIPKHDSVTDSSSFINIPVKSDQIETGLTLNSCDIDKLASCTESLGFESHNESSQDSVFEDTHKSRANVKFTKFDKETKKIKNKSFPPPLSTFDDKGKPTFFLHPVRNNGRLKLIKVNINTPDQSLGASRDNGRLRLHLLESDHKIDDVITSTDAV